MESLFKWAMGLSIFFATLQMLSESGIESESASIDCTQPESQKKYTCKNSIAEAKIDSVKIYQTIKK